MKGKSNPSPPLVRILETQTAPRYDDTAVSGERLSHFWRALEKQRSMMRAGCVMPREAAEADGLPIRVH